MHHASDGVEVESQLSREPDAPPNQTPTEAARPVFQNSFKQLLY
jgi:hypothetical protein